MSDYPYGSAIERGPMAADNFTQVANALFRDPRISYRAKGIFGYMASHAEGWRVTEKAIVAAGTEGRDAVRTALRELEAHHYLKRWRERDEKGRLGTSSYYITDVPAHLLELLGEDAAASATEAWAEQNCRSEPVTGNPSTGNPSTGYPHTKKTNTKNTNHQKIKSPPGVGSLSRSGPTERARVREDERETQPAPPADEQPEQPVEDPEPAAHSADVTSVYLAYLNAYGNVLPPTRVRDQLLTDTNALLADGWPVEHVAMLAAELPGLGYTSLATHAGHNPPPLPVAERVYCPDHPSTLASTCGLCVDEDDVLVGDAVEAGMLTAQEALQQAREAMSAGRTAQVSRVNRAGFQAAAGGI